MSDEKTEFDQFSDNYDEILNAQLKGVGGNSSYFAYYKVQIVAANEPTNDRLDILDFGCGVGNSSAYFRELFPQSKITGIDVSADSIKSAQSKKIANCAFLAFEGLTLPFEDQKFDVVFTSMVFHHIPHEKHEAFFKEIYRVMKPGGSFYIFEHNPYNPITRKIVKECEFDHDAVLLYPMKTKKFLTRIGFNQPDLNFTLFFPRHQIFKPFFNLENWMRKLPIGGQYYVHARKDK